MKFPMCTLSNIVNPGMYIVVTTDKEHVLEVKNLEERMTKEMLRNDTSDVKLKAKMCVAVKDRRKLSRGIVEKDIGNDYYEVLLMDSGHIVKVHRSAIIIITNKDFIKVEPLAFMVKLYGLIPARYISFGDVREPKACKEWGSESQEFVENFFKHESKVVVQSILIQQRTVYGDLFIKDHSKMKYVSLRKLLCKNKFCAYSVTAFLRHEGLNVPSESVEMETKMEMVKKWQKESFGQFKQNTYQLPSPVLSPQASISDVTTLNLSESKSSAYQRTDPAEKEEGSVTFSEKPGAIGLGRGNLKLMIAEMKNKEKAAAQTSSTPCRSGSSDKIRREAGKSTCGRGQNMKMVLEMMKTRQGGSSPGTSYGAETDSTKDSERFADVGAVDIPPGPSATGSGRGPIVSRVESAVVKPGEFSEFGDSNGLTEVSLSMEDDPAPPPLVRNSTKKSNLESSELKGGESVCQNDIGKGDEIKNSWEKLKLDCEKKEGSCPDEQKLHLECSKLNENESWCCETNPQVREQPLELSAANCCWTPLVLFDDSVVESINNIRELPIQPSIIKNLERRGAFRFLSQVQRWAIPTIRKQHNTVLISGSRTGKTLSYLISLIDYVQDESYFEELPPGNGPSVVIVASSAYVCESIYYTCHYLLGHMHQKDTEKSRIRLVLAHGSGCEKEIWVTLTNGCDILICTPPCLVRLLEFPVLTNFERLTCLVLDEVDIICENPFRKMVRIIFEGAQLNTRDRHYQKILCGEKWTLGVERLVKTYVKSYALVIGSYSEAVIYKKLKPSIFLVDKSQKPEILVEKLKDKMHKSKVVIFCEATVEAVFLFKFLTDKGFTPLITHEKILAEKLKECERIWKNSTHSLLIITDGVLGDLDIREAQVLVHYSLPSKSKTNFFVRYSVVLNSYRANHSFEKDKSRSGSEQVHTVILVDDRNHYQLPHIAEFVTRLGEKLPQAIAERCEDIRRTTEVGKSTSPICGNLLAFGRCRNWRNCPRRHAMVKALDSPENLPLSGWVNFVVVKTHDASLFSVRLLEHIGPEGGSTKFEDRRSEINLSLAEHFRVADNRRPLGCPKVGSMCAVRRGVQKEEFYRGKVVEYLKLDKHDMPLEVGVKLLDEGDVCKQKSAELYELPEDLWELPPVAVDVRVVGVQPKDFDVGWSEIASAFAKCLMTEKLEANQYWSGRIVLALNNTLFLDPIKRKQFLPQLNFDMFDMVVRTELLNNQIAVTNNEHLPSLLKLSKEAGIEQPKKKETKKEDSAKIQPQWAFFDSDVIEVRFLAAENTSVVFLQPKKHEKLLSLRILPMAAIQRRVGYEFQASGEGEIFALLRILRLRNEWSVQGCRKNCDRLEALEQDCQKEGEKAASEVKILEAKKSSAAVPAFTVGGFCLARFEDGKWNRGRIEAEKENEVYVFFIDHGDFLLVGKQDVVAISQSLLLRLPCQAIECRLTGIEEEKECPLEVLQEIYAFSEDGKRELYAYVVSRESEPVITRGRKYDVNLVDEEGVSLNKMLVERKMVRAKESERCNLENKEVRSCAEEEYSEGEGDGEGDEEAEAEEEAQESFNGEYLLDSYLKNLKDEVFEDEDGLEFLKEFASRLFPNVNGFQEVPESAQKERKEAGRKVAANSPEVKAAKQNIQWLLELQKKRRSRSKKDLELKCREVLTPQVLWYQTQEEVRLKILLGNVEDWSFECTHSNLSFRCVLGEKFYAVDLRLFGAVNPRMTEVRAKAFHVLVVLAKLAYPVWPRLPLDQGKHRWISLDVDGLKDEEDDFSDKIKEAKAEIESGRLKKGIREEKIQPCSDLEDSDEEINSDSENSDDDI